MKRLTTCALATTAVWLLLGSHARADVTFNYSWSMTPDVVIPAGTGSASFALGGAGTLSSPPGDTAFLLAALVSTSSSASNTPDTFNESFNLALTLTDVASGESGTFNFAGTLQGTLTLDSANLLAAFSNPAQTLPLGAYQYAVTLNPASANLPVPGSDTQTLLEADVVITPKPDGPKPPETPEPSSLVLGVSAALVWLAQRRARRHFATSSSSCRA